ncbi:MAG TPA: hypothetical protein VJY62_11870 [Bacteroidia bacterium]|nr:hypothetical protein [Bacteroidia bacterium]
MYNHTKTNFRFTVRFTFLFTLAALFIFSCKRDEEKPGWETNILTPLLKSSLSINDILSDTLLQTGSDNVVKVVYENHLYKMSLDSLFDLPDTSVTKIYNLDSISLFSTTISNSITLLDVANNIGGIIGQLIIASNGTMNIIPPFGPLPADTVSINADTLFSTMTLISGFIDISIHNGFPIPLDNVTYELKNALAGTVIATGVFPSIPPNSTQTQTIDLAGKTVEGNMLAIISNMSTPGSGGPVLIDITDSLTASLYIHDLHPSTATAIFPAQDLINKSQPFRLHLDPVQLKEAIVKSGYVEIVLYSTLQDSVHFTYSLPSATLNGIPFSVSRTLPPAQSGGVSSDSTTYNFAGYDLDMTGPNGDTINDMYNSFIASIDSTGLMKTISITDSMYANISFNDLVPSYGKGYLGQQSFNIGPSQLLIDIFKNLHGSLDLEDVKLSIVTENGIGADAQVYLSDLKSFNSNTGNTVTLSGSAVSSPFHIQRATETGNQSNPVNVVNSEYLLNKSNSNAPAFLSNMPDKLNYTMSLMTNPNGNVNNWGDFIYSDHLMEFNIDVEMPLSYKANDLNFTLTDTAVFTLSEQDVSRIKDGTLTLIVDNGFPFSVDISLQMLNLNGDVINTLVQNSIIESATVGSNGKVSEKKRSKINISVDQPLINKLFDTSKMKISAKYSTTTNGSIYYKIYSDYTIDFQLTGDFTYIAHY